jgi:hypothetical protein
MLEKIMGAYVLSESTETLYMAACQVRGGVDKALVLKWYPTVNEADLDTLLAEMDEYDKWSKQCS